MMESQRLKKIDFFVIIWGAILCSGSVFLWDLPVFLGVLFGALLASTNWVGLRFLLMRLMSDKTKKKVHYAVLLGAKMLVFFTAVGLLVLFAPINKIGLVVGLSSLVLGIFTYSFKSAFSSGGEAALEKDF